MTRNRQSQGIRISRSKLLRTAEITIIIVAALMLIGFIGRYINESQFADRFPAYGRHVQVDGFDMHIDCRGEGSPTIVIDAPEEQWSLFMRELQDEADDETRVCIYDRAGLGWSEGSPNDRTAANMAGELHTLLQNAGEDGPFVLVGFGFSGWNSLLYAYNYPDEVVGLLLVNTPAPNYTSYLPQPAYQRWVNRQERRLVFQRFTARLGAVTVIPGLPEPNTTPEDQPAYQAIMRFPLSYSAMLGELRGRAVSAQQVAEVTNLPQTIYTITSTTPLNPDWAPANYPVDAHNQGWQDMEAELGVYAFDTQQYLIGELYSDFYVEIPEYMVELMLDVAGIEHQDGE